MGLFLIELAVELRHYGKNKQQRRHNAIIERKTHDHCTKHKNETGQKISFCPFFVERIKRKF